MKVFISWSGDRSRAVAEVLDEWLQCVLQAVDPWMSTKDIDRGALWFNEIHDQLAHTTLGIVCLTQENKNKPWILFESGALAKGLSSSRVCTFLIDLQPADVGSPLGQFNHTLPDREGLHSLVRTLNTSLVENSLKEKVLDQVFETYWPHFQKRFNDALKKHPQTEAAEPRTPESMMEELVLSVRRLDKRFREFEALKNENTSHRNASASDAPRMMEERTAYAKHMVGKMVEDDVNPDRIVELLCERGYAAHYIRELILRSSS